MSKVSVVVPVYNVEMYLEECIDSILNQTYTDLELILVDDGSTDSSGDICDKYAGEDNRVVVIHQKNAGAANAKNAGLDVANGKYITFADSDDVVEPFWIETMVNLLVDNNADMVECAFDKFYVNSVESVKDCLYKGEFTAESYMAQYLSRWTNSLFWIKLFKKELTQDIRFRKERRCIDDEFYTYKVVSNAKKIVKTDAVLYHYRQRKSSAVQSPKNQLQITDDAMELRIERYEWIKKRFPSLKKQYISNDIDFLIYFSKNGVFDNAVSRKYRKIARYYFKEALKIKFDAGLVLNSVKFLLCKLNIGNCFKEENGVTDREYFA